MTKTTNLKKRGTKTRKTRKKSTRSILKSRGSVTQKTQSENLKKTITRRSRSRKTKELIDSSVPTVLKLEKSNYSSRKHLDPNVSIGDEHDYSPFVLQLSDKIPSPQEILDEETFSVRLNLLDGQTHKQADTHANDLALNEHEIKSQLVENSLTSLGVSRLALPLKSQITPIALPKRIDFSVPKGVFENFKLGSIIPNDVPENIFSYFEFPEDEEDVEEAELVTLDQLHKQVDTPQKKKTPKRFKLPELPLPQGWQRAMGAFVMVSFVFVLPLHAMNVIHELQDTKTELETTSEQALSYFEAGTSAALEKQTKLAASSFQLAEASFASANKSLKNLGSGASLILSSLPMTSKTFTSSKALVNTLKELSTAGARLSEGFVSIEATTNPSPLSRLEQLEIYLTSALPHIKEAEQSIKKVSIDSVPEEHQKELQTLIEQLPTLRGSIEEFLSMSDMIKFMLGQGGAKRYLLIFQNNTEMRPTGGFMGSFAELKVRDGEIESLTVPGGGTYDLQGSLTKFVAAPEPLQLLKARWEFQDTNWFPDFPTSARQILEFYSASGGPSIDGVIAINATFVAKLIGLLGPIEMPEYDRTISEENFLFETQKIVEFEYDKEENKPKAFIGDLAEKILNTTNDRSLEEFLALFEHTNLGLFQKDILLYFPNNEIQRQIQQNGWSGEIKQTQGDYLMVVNTNLGGGKTDGVIDEHVHVDVQVNDVGEILNTVTIRRTHNGIPGLVFTGVNNVNYTRLYVPKGSTLISADGFDIPPASLFEEPEEDWQIDDDLLFIASTKKTDPASGTTITEEFGKTAFGNWIQTMPGKTSVARFTYKLPFTINDLQNPSLLSKLKTSVGLSTTKRYTLTVQKQPGMETRSTTFSINAPEQLEQKYTSYPENESIKNEKDELIGVLFESKSL